MESLRCGTLLTLGTASEEQIVHRGSASHGSNWPGIAVAARGRPGLRAGPQGLKRSPRRPDHRSGDDQQSWKGDLDGMIERRIVRVLTVPARPSISTTRARSAASPYDASGCSRGSCNKRLAAGQEAQGQESEGGVVFSPGQTRPVSAALAEGKGDIAAANLTITPERRETGGFRQAGTERRQRGRGHGAGLPEGRHAWTTSPARKSSCASRRATTRAWSR